MAEMTLQAAIRLARQTDVEAGESGHRPRAAAWVLAQVIEEVRRIHSPENRGTELVCAGCGLDGHEEPYDWPCATAKAISGNPRAELTVRWDG